MKDQYAGDISDYIKFSLLRAFMGGEGGLGVAWFHTDGHDNTTDGGHIEYLDDDSMEALDPHVFALLRNMILDEGQRRIATMELMSFWPDGSLFHNIPVPTKNVERSRWFEGVEEQMSAAAVVFVDPDTGIKASRPYSRKHIDTNELMSLAKSKRPVICIQFPWRVPKSEQIHSVLDAYRDYKPCLLFTEAKYRKNSGHNTVSRRWFLFLNASKKQSMRIVKFADVMNAIEGLTAEVHPIRVQSSSIYKVIISILALVLLLVLWIYTF